MEANKLSVDDIIKLIKEAKEAGLSFLKLPSLAIRFDALKEKYKERTPITLHDVPDFKIEDIIKPESSLDNMTDEEIKYYATPYYDELQAAKNREVTHD